MQMDYRLRDMAFRQQYHDEHGLFSQCLYDSALPYDRPLRFPSLSGLMARVESRLRKGVRSLWTPAQPARA
ncbi:hypothetical protein QOL99_10580 [Deinococcus sp. MIMF12]|uniref:Uncharacterized protein n=1 Tax=Deinococcus rhizophilus TaxID=3049544 RepID=A0ABT7JJG4_9DEIO|nr:hypothetical protein [Deinococcus rhizophilus]MDL2344598.1 hypothetical protein [Deinococcus rhizophilus]